MQSIANILSRGAPSSTPPPLTPPPQRPTANGGDFPIATLAELDASHAPAVGHMIAVARGWKEQREQTPGLSLVLCASRTDEIITGRGIGKTHIARAILWMDHYTADNGRPIAPAGARAYMAGDVTARLHASENFSHDLRGMFPPLTNYDGIYRAIIDDLGTEPDLPFVSAANQAEARTKLWFRVVDHCYNGRISLIITSNLTIPQLANHIGDRAWSRLNEMAPAGLILDLTGKVADYRVKRSGRAK